MQELFDPDVGVLGPPVVRRGGALADVRGARQRLLLAVLLTADRSLSTDELTDALWGEALPADPRGALQLQVFRLRKQLPAAVGVETAPDGYLLRARPGSVDADVFESLLARARRAATAQESLALVEAALALWRGPAFQGVIDHAGVRLAAARLDELRVEAAETRAAALLGLGRAADAAAVADRLAAEHPYRERPVALAMAALTTEGRHAQAQAAYAELRRRLRGDLGVEPSPELRTQAEALRRDALRTAPTPGVGLPGNSFHGRAAQISAVVEALGNARLVTLTGPGGVGKTRLALHAVGLLAPRFPDGVHVCELAPVADPSGVPAALAATLRAGEVAGRTTLERVVDLLSAQRALLVLDNCEHVRPGANRLIAAVLAGAPYVRVLATSRQRLGVDGEQCHAVPPLPAPPAHVSEDGPATALFADRAAAVRPGFRLTEANRPSVAELCRRLDGLPLAIELAAARAVSRTPAEILLALTGGQMPTLADERRTVARHRSIDAVIGWSHALLDDESRAAFEELAVFAGGCTAEAAAAVTSAGDRAGDVLAGLTEHSLVSAHDGVEGIRFRMLEPVRQFAMARLAGRGALRNVRERHAAYLLGWAERTGALLEGPDEPVAAAALRADLDNLRAAHLWFMGEGSRPADAVRLGGALYYWCLRGCPAEIYGWAAAAAEASTDPPQPALQRCLALAIRGAWLAGDGERARAMGARAFSAAPAAHPEFARWVCPEMASTEMLAGDLDAAVRYSTLGIELCARGDDHVLGAYAPLVRALSVGYRDGAAAAAPDLEEGSARIGHGSPPSVVAYRDYVAGEVRVTHDPAGALPLLRRSRDHATLHGNRFYAAAAGLSALCCAVRVGDPADAPAATADLIDEWHRMGAWSGLWLTLRALTEMLAMLECDEHASVLLGAVTGGPTAPALFGPDADRVAATADTLARTLGAARFEQFRTLGAALDGEQAVAYAKAALATLSCYW